MGGFRAALALFSLFLLAALSFAVDYPDFTIRECNAASPGSPCGFSWNGRYLRDPPVYYLGETYAYYAGLKITNIGTRGATPSDPAQLGINYRIDGGSWIAGPSQPRASVPAAGASAIVTYGPLGFPCDASHIGTHQIELSVDPANQWPELPPNGEGNNGWSFSYECRDRPNLYPTIDSYTTYMGNNTVVITIHNSGTVDAGPSSTRIGYGWNSVIPLLATPAIPGGSSYTHTTQSGFCEEYCGPAPPNYCNGRNCGNLRVWADYGNVVDEFTDADNFVQVDNTCEDWDTCTCKPNGMDCLGGWECCTSYCNPNGNVCGGNLDLALVSVASIPPLSPLRVPRGAAYTYSTPGGGVLYGMKAGATSTAGLEHIPYSPASNWPLVLAGFSPAPGVWTGTPGEARANYYNSQGNWVGTAVTEILLNCSTVGSQTLRAVLDSENRYAETDENNNEIGIPFECTDPEVFPFPGSLTFSLNPPIANENFDAIVNIWQRGAGGLEAGFPIARFTSSWGQQQTASVPAANAGWRNASVNAMFTCPSAGSKSMTALADPNNQYNPELDEANNSLSANFNCVPQVIDLTGSGSGVLGSTADGYGFSFQVQYASSDGTITAPFTMRVEWEGNDYDHVINTPLPPRSSGQYAQSITCHGVGNKTLRVISDALGNVAETPPAGEANNIWETTVECQPFSVADCADRLIYPACGARSGGTPVACWSPPYRTLLGDVTYACWGNAPSNATGICARNSDPSAVGICNRFDGTGLAPDCNSVPGCYRVGNDCRSYCDGKSQVACTADARCWWHSNQCENNVRRCPSSITPYACLILDCRCSLAGETCYSDADCCAGGGFICTNQPGGPGGVCSSKPDYAGEITDADNFVHTIGSTFTITLTTRNIGGAGTTASSNSKFRSNLNGGPDEITNIPVSGLAPGAANVYTLGITCPATPSRTPINLSVDNATSGGGSQIDEARENNNVANVTLACCVANGGACGTSGDCCDWSCIGGICTQPADLVPLVSEVAPAAHPIGTAFDVRVRNRNDGAGNAGASVTNLTFGAANIDVPMPSITAGTTSASFTRAFACTEMGTIPLYARADKDGAVAESDEGNNLNSINIQCDCAGSGNSCTNPADCCGGFSCAPDPLNPSNDICRVCSALGSGCATNADCCVGNCAGAPSVCTDCQFPPGACTSDADCCTGNCIGTPGVCTTTLDLIPTNTTPFEPRIANQPFWAHLRISNRGPGAAVGTNARILFASGAPIDVTIPPLASGSHYDLDVPLRCPPTANTYPLSFIADFGNLIAETPLPDAENNNQQSYSMQCNAPLPLIPGPLDWQWVAWIAFLIAAVFLALAYMASKMVQQPGLEAWVKIELGELFVSVIIIVLVLGLVSGANAFVQFLTGDANYQDAALTYLSSFRDSAGDLYNRMAEVSFRVNRAVGFSYSGGTGIGYASATYSTSPRSGMSALLGSVNSAMDSLSLAILFIEAQRLFAVFFSAIAVITFPLGLVLRTFPLTRKIGAVILASAIATAVVYPLGLVVSKGVYDAYAPPLASRIANLPHKVPDMGTPPGVLLYCNPVMQAFTSGFGLGEIFYDIVICTPICAVTTVGFWACFKGCMEVVQLCYYIATSGFSAAMLVPLQNYATKVPVEQYFDAVNQYALPATTEMIVLSIVLSLLPIIAAVVSLRGLSTVFGGEAQLYGLYKIL